MLKISEADFYELECKYEGIVSQIRRFEESSLPDCPDCGTSDTAEVNVGIIGRTILLSAATTKFKLIPNAPKEGDYWCNECRTYFDT